MKAQIHLQILLITGTLFALACSKGGASTWDNDNPHTGPTSNDTIPPALTINTPVPNQVYSSGHVINITGRIADDLGLYRGSVRVSNDSTGLIFKEQPYEIHGLLSYDFTVSYTANVATVASLTITIFFEDHGANVTAKSVKVKVNP